MDRHIQNNEIGPLSYTIHKNKLKVGLKLKYGLKTISLTSGAGNSGQPLVKGLDVLNFTYDLVEKVTSWGLRLEHFQ